MKESDLEQIQSILPIPDLLTFTKFVTGHKLKDVKLDILQYDIVCVKIKRALLVIANDAIDPSKQVSILNNYTTNLPISTLDTIIISEKIAPLFTKISMFMNNVELTKESSRYVIKFKSTDRMIVDVDLPAGVRLSTHKEGDTSMIVICNDRGVVAKASVDVLSDHDKVITGVSLSAKKYNLADSSNCIIKDIDYTHKDYLNYLLRVVLKEYTSPKYINYIYIYVGDQTELDTVWKFAIDLGFSIDSSYNQYVIT